MRVLSAISSSPQMPLGKAFNLQSASKELLNSLSVLWKSLEPPLILYIIEKHKNIHGNTVNKIKNVTFFFPL